MTIYEDAFHIDDKTMAMLGRRLQERAGHGERPVVVNLPEGKAGYPRLLCLDMNMWVGLASAHYGQPKGENFKSALGSIQQAIDRGQLVVPVLQRTPGKP
jgi:hypothetical protein